MAGATGAATVLVTWHPAPPDLLAAHVARAREALAGTARVRPARPVGGGSEPGWAATFPTADAASAWLASAGHAALVDAARRDGVLRSRAEVLVATGEAPPPGVALFDHPVRTGGDAAFLATQRALLDRAERFAGHDGAVLVAPDDEVGWTSVVLFRTDEQLAAWLGSAERDEVLPGLRRTLAGRDFHAVTRSAGFGSVVTVDGAGTRVTPEWKTAMLVLLVLYPTVMLLSRFLGPVLDTAGAPPWLAMWVSQIVSVAAMTYALVPGAVALFRRWLTPGALARTNALGAAVVLACYAATLAVFATVTWLQFWDFGD